MRAFFLAMMIVSAGTGAAPPRPPRPPALSYSMSFVVYPADTQHMGTLFGGKILAEMDRTAGIAARRLLYSSPGGVRNAVTTSAFCTFIKPGRVGDLVFVTATADLCIEKLMHFKIKVERELDGGEREKLAEGLFVFAAYDPITKKAVPHGLPEAK